MIVEPHDERFAAGLNGPASINRAARTAHMFVHLGDQEKRAIAHARLEAPLLNAPSLHLSRKLDETGDVLLNVQNLRFNLA